MSNQPPNQNFGPYEILDLLGRGGMGEVYRARDARKGRVIALKLLPRALSGDPRFRARFEREAHIAANLNDPHVVPIHDYGEIDGVLYIEMAMIDGTDLRTRLRTNGPMHPEEAANLIAAIGSALDTAHQQGLLHRDVKPENILLTDKGFPYLTDFGIAAQQDETRLTSTGTAVGSMSYMAPERFDDGELTPAVDEYALACVLYECLTGRPPFHPSTTSAMIRAHLMNEPPSLQHTGLPPAVDTVIKRGLAKDPQLRFGSGVALASALREAYAGRVDDNTANIANTAQGPGAPTQAHPVPPAGTGSYDPHQRPTETVAIGAAGGGTTGWGDQAAQHPGSPPAGSGNGRSKTPMIVGGVAALVVVALVAGYLLFGRGDDKANAGAPSPTAPAATQNQQSDGGQSDAAPPSSDPQQSTPPPAQDSSSAGTAPYDGPTGDEAPDTVTQNLSEMQASSSDDPDVDDGTIGGKPFSRAVTADSCGYDYETQTQTFSWSLNGQWETFSGMAGIPDDNDEDDNTGSVQIVADSETLWKQDLKLNSPAKKFNVSVKGKNQLIIKFTGTDDICSASVALPDAKLTGKNGVAPAPTAS